MLESQLNTAEKEYETQVQLIEQGVNPFAYANANPAPAPPVHNPNPFASNHASSSPNPGVNRKSNRVCDGCRCEINIPAYHCTFCIDYDLCERCFLGRKTSKTHQIGHPMVKMLKTTYRSDLLTMDKLTRLFARAEYDEHERCIFCFNRLKGLTFRVSDKEGRVCNDCGKVLTNSRPIYIGTENYCANCNRLVDDCFVCVSCTYETHYQYSLCVKCCTSGVEKGAHKISHHLKLIQKGCNY